MKRFVLVVAVAVLTCAGAAAESSVWKAQKDNFVMYLGGTFHLLRAADYPLPPEFDKAYQQSEIVVFETDIGKLQAPETQQRLLEKSIYDDGSTVDKHLSARSYADLRAYCVANGIPLQMLARFKPAILMTTLAVMEFVKLGATQQGVDHYFHTQAKKDRKDIEELETVDEQINFIVSMADGIEDEFVTYSISDMKTLKEQYTLLVDAWRSGDAGKIAAIMVADHQTRQPGIYEKLIVARNRNWLALFDGYQKSNRTRFVLVGAGHLVGPDGIIEALKKKGYQVDKLY